MAQPIGLSDNQIEAIGRGDDVIPPRLDEKLITVAGLFQAAFHAQAALTIVKQETYSVRFDRTIADLRTALYAVARTLTGEQFHSLIELDSLAARLNDIRAISCGCCTVGCVCNNHMDVPQGKRPKRCALHSGTGEVVFLDA